MTRHSSSCLLGINFVLIVTLGTALPLSAALPSLSLQKLENMSDRIFTGTVTDVRQRLIDEGGGFVDREYFIDIRVSEVAKGDVAVGDVVTGTTWNIHQRPDGFAGPQGQNVIPAKGDAVKFYTREVMPFRFRSGGEGTAFVILEPNGIVKFSQASSIPKAFLGTWSSIQKNADNTITTTLTIDSDGSYELQFLVQNANSGKGSAARGTATVNGAKLALGGNIVVAVLSDGRMLWEEGDSAQIFKKVGGGITGRDVPVRPIDRTSESFAKHLKITVQQQDNGELKVISADPSGPGYKEGVRSGFVITSWTFNEETGFWSAKWNPEVNSQSSGSVTPATPAGGKAEKFARHLKIEVQQRDNGELKVISVDPSGLGFQRGLRNGYVITSWTFNEETGVWEAKWKFE